MPKTDKPEHPNAIRARLAREAGKAVAESIAREREEERRHQKELVKVRRAAELEAARKAGMAAGLGIDLVGISDTLKEIAERLEKIEERLSEEKK